MGTLRWALVCAALLLLTGCAGQQTPRFFVLDQDEGVESVAEAVDALLAQDPGGPVPEPDIPPDLREAAARKAPLRPGDDADTVIRYEVRAVSPTVPELESSFLDTSPLTRLADIPLHTMTGLERRLKQSLDHAQDILRSHGYYTGRVRGTIIPPGETFQDSPGSSGGFFGSILRNRGGSPAGTGGTGENGGNEVYTVRVAFQPGSLYHTGKSAIIPAPPPASPEEESSAPSAPEESSARTPSGHTAAPEPPSSEPAVWPGPPDAPPLPSSLADVGLPQGSPAEAAAVLSAINRITDEFRNKGYPFAAIASTRHTLDHSTRELESEIRVRSGDFARMGALEIRGEPDITSYFLENLQTWEKGEPWNQDKVEAFRENLRGTALFRSITLSPGDPQAGENGENSRSVVTELEDAPPRTVGGAVKYDTTFGLGLEAFWEHRNLTGRGDSFRTDMPVWQDMQELSAKYRLPFFFSPKQDFIAQGAVLNQTTDAYDITAARIAAGIERRINRRWTASAMFSVEGGSLKDPDEPRRDYLMFGVPLSAAWSDANSLLDATKGSRVVFSAAPYVGKFRGNFTALRTRVDAFTYLPLAGKDTLVLALRGGVGSLWGVESNEVPASVRFYSGGGGSVRGFAYQSLGPRNANKDPLGGSSVLEVSVEPRWRITETLGMVAFVDGGMVYDNTPDFEFGRDMRWGAGVGFRFFTAIGPLRFDVATPLNPRSDDDRLQFYISIGQSF